MADALNVLVLGGGPDRERSVSLRSAEAIADALRRAGHHVTTADVTPEDTTALRRHKPDVVFPALHGRFGEGGPLQRLLEAQKLRYVGARPHAAGVAMDKCAAKQVADKVGVPTPPYQRLSPTQTCGIAPPVVIKPLTEGSSFGVELCDTAEQVKAARKRQHSHFAFILAEKWIKNSREITVGILGNELLPAIEVSPAEGFYDFQAKYDRDDTGYSFDIDLPESVMDRINRDAWRMFEGVGCRHLARVDFIVDPEHNPWFIEINTMPGFTDHSLVPMAARRIGLEMPDLCDRLVRLALGR